MNYNLVVFIAWQALQIGGIRCMSVPYNVALNICPKSKESLFCIPKITISLHVSRDKQMLSLLCCTWSLFCLY